MANPPQVDCTPQVLLIIDPIDPHPLDVQLLFVSKVFDNLIVTILRRFRICHYIDVVHDGSNDPLDGPCWPVFRDEEAAHAEVLVQDPDLEVHK